MFVPHGQYEERSGNAERHDPDQRNLHDGVLLLLGVPVAQRVRQGHVPVILRSFQGHVAVDGDHAQMTDGRRREQHVEAVPADTDQLWNWHICIQHLHDLLTYLLN